jgi:hypothetical protein
VEEEEEFDVEEEDLVIEGSDETIVSDFVLAQTELEDVLPVVGTPCVSRSLLNPVNGGRLVFHQDLSATLESNFDSVEAEMTGTHEDKAAERAHNEQLFRTRTKKALVASVKRTVEGDANMRLIAKTLDGVLQHNNFMSETARGHAKSNVTFAILLHEQKNLIKALSDSVAHLGRDYRSLNDKVDQSHKMLAGKITDVHNEDGNINDNVNSIKSENATANATADANAAAAKL